MLITFFNYIFKFIQKNVLSQLHSLNKNQNLSQLFFNIYNSLCIISRAILDLNRNFDSRHHPMRSICYCAWLEFSAYCTSFGCVRDRMSWKPMSFPGPTLHANLINLCFVFQCKLNISCIMSCGNKLVLTCKPVDWLLLHYYISQLLLGGKKLICNCCITETVKTEEIVCLHSEATARNMQPCGAGSALIWTWKKYNSCRKFLMLLGVE